MLERVRNILGRNGSHENGDADGYRELVEEQERLIRDLRSEISALKKQQREIEQELDETQVRSDFKRIQLNHELQALKSRTSNLDATEQQLRDVAIEEKVDTSRISEELEQLQADTADTGDVRERLQTLHDYVDAQYDALKEDITTLDTAIHDTVEEMRHDLVDSFRKEFLALETVLTYEIDALEAKDRWAREDLADRVSALHESVQEDLVELETETISLLKTNTEALEDELDQRTDSLSRAQDALEAQLSGRMDDMKAEVQEQLDALPDADQLEKMIVDTSEAQGDIAELRDDIELLREELEDQQDQIDAAREELQDSLDEAMDAITEQEVQPLKDAMESFRTETTSQIEELEGTVQEDVEQLVRRKDAKIMGLDRRLDRLSQRIDQELAASEAAQNARRQEVQDALQDRLSDQADDIDALRNGISQALTMIEDVDDNMANVRTRIESLADADDVDALRNRVDMIREVLDETAVLDELEQLQERVDILQYAVDAVDVQSADGRTVEELQGDVNTLQDRFTDMAGRKADRDVVNDLQEYEDRHD